MPTPQTIKPGEQRRPLVESACRPRMSSSPTPTSASPPPRNQRTARRSDELARDRRDDERQQRDRQEAHARLERRVAEHVLDVEREVEEHREHRRPTGRRRRSRRRRTSACGTARGRASGARALRSIDDERDQQRRPKPISSTTISGLPQPSTLPRMSAKTSTNSAPENVTEPAQSIAAAGRVARLVDHRERQRRSPRRRSAR